MDDKLKKALEDLKEGTPDYPPELKTATKAEYTTHLKTMRKKGKGCPFMVLTFIATLLLAYVAGM